MANSFDTLSDNTKKIITISKKGGSDRSYQAIITSTDQSGGAKDFEGIATQSGGRLKNYRPQEDIEVTLEGYAVEVGTNSGTTGNGFSDLINDYNGSSQPISISNDHSRDEYRLVIMRTDNFAQTSATAVTTAGDKAVRWTYKNGHFTNVVASDTDNIVQFTLTYKCTPFDKDGNANVTDESTDGTVVLPAISAYS